MYLPAKIALASSLFWLMVAQGKPRRSTDKPKPTPVAQNPYYALLPVTQIPELKQKPCAFLHVWATWCTPCLQELPDLLKALATLKGVTPIIIDVSSPFVQDNFSRKWVEALKPAFLTYGKPPGAEDPYLRAIDPQWSGGLPYSVIYDKGRRKKAWTGVMDLSQLASEVATHCSLPRAPVK